MSGHWDVFSAHDVLMRRDKAVAAQAATAGVVCPACGAPADVDMINVSTPARRQFVPGLFMCSAECWRAQPERYLDAVKGLA